jgi:hypothetical protein
MLTYNICQREYFVYIVAEKYSMEISTEKTKIMAFCGKEPVPSIICLNNKILERVNEFKYLGYKLSFMGELDLPKKISKYSSTMGIINNILKPTLVQKHTRIYIYIYIYCYMCEVSLVVALALLQQFNSTTLAFP